ncbi:hypothetical protein TrRE_jg322 [Triparma retinervis]|uniref:Coenzyme PQQ synthesis protein F-like C-terminal lobe domain-containing protein n=1 Tax=Triparma retinervis TaxID=2557542 RepID=A0A9W7DM26_9STRA|nr:hypothetical protein TrRE_jg322 [Triparma retinervis]
MVNVLAHLLCEPAFDILRTKETLGYIVYSARKLNAHVVGLQFIIQGDANPPDYLDERVEAFLETFRSKMVSMTEEEFGANKDSVVEKLLEKDKNLNEESGRYYAYISRRTYTFQRASQLAERIRTSVGKGEVLAFFDDVMRRGGKGRRKLTTMVYGKGQAMPEQEEGGRNVVEGDKGNWKRTCRMWAGLKEVDFKEFE